ncbi:entericidin A/B family lipoprotein [Polaromonas jejuensis]|uniref:Entericidin A/B family lipoprotein n=1 Tax=Polaromonas jejuensis TaxID=457502 RepID=A0ABW0QAU1_9BURK|nr:entericidin A/B family lipoprotein [Polaromonas jejuensis]
MKKISSLLMIALTVLPALLLGGCNTMKGFGQDVQRAGTAVENAAKK